MRPEWATQISLQDLRPLASLFSEDLAIDLGTVNTRVYARGRGIVVNELSAVALDGSTGEVQAVGREAKEMLGRTPGKIRVIKPLKDGVIADFKVTENMLSYFIQKAHQRRTLVHPRVIISVPSEITQVERRAVTDSAYRAKAAEVHLVEQAMMAAIGAGFPLPSLAVIWLWTSAGVPLTSPSFQCPASSIRAHCAPLVITWTSPS